MRGGGARNRDTHQVARQRLHRNLSFRKICKVPVFRFQSESCLADLVEIENRGLQVKKRVGIERHWAIETEGREVAIIWGRPAYKYDAQSNRELEKKHEHCASDIPTRRKLI